jgi:hypothetical protein
MNQLNYLTNILNIHFLAVMKQSNGEMNWLEMKEDFNLVGKYQIVQMKQDLEM